MMPLYQRLANRVYKKHQTLDRPSLVWLEKNLEIDNMPFSVEPLSALEFSLFIPKKSWFLRRNIQTIHGVTHTLRVMVFTYLLCVENNIPNIRPYLAAAAIHDLKRKNDNSDEDHGLRASEWFIRSKVFFKKILSEEEAQQVSEAVYFHDLPDKVEKNSILNILVCADALDRFRLAKKKWWLNPAYLPIPVSDTLVNFAKRFILESESNHLVLGMDPYDAVLEATKHFQILK